ncbi:hypothetical protein F8M41_003610 [Gigaspora margarita]|uniref:Uncharacterized protein n=1 Tax=Gigaspora margarita TaxID=4874 RepID=A0A8H3XBS9_GIGMA|nr:hypothetical protein F8M41_003610 [Gigaspora margarita]
MRNIQNNDNEDNNNASSSSKSSRSQNQSTLLKLFNFYSIITNKIFYKGNVTFEDKTDNASISHIATNILDILPEDNIGNNDDSQQNDNYSISSNKHNNYEEFQSANSLIAISSNEYEEEFQLGILEKQRNHEVSQIPAKFGRINNILEICNWLDSACIWDEKIKCLFLRAKFPLATCIDKFVRKIFGLNQTVLGHVKNYKEIQERQGVTLLTNKNINNYINEKVTMDVLHRFIGGTNQSELKRYDAVKKLVQLIRGIFKIYWQSKNIDQVKNLNNLTKNKHVPSRSSLDIASKLNLN